jgi:hypothetical protein
MAVRVKSFTITETTGYGNYCTWPKCRNLITHQVKWIVADGPHAGAYRSRWVCPKHLERWRNTHYEQHQIFPA